MQHLGMRIFAAFIGLSLGALLYAQEPPDKKDKAAAEISAITVTGMSVRQGGAQDANYFRGEVEGMRIPHPNDLTAEGLMGEHDIQLPSDSPCRQLFCLTGEAARADLIALPEARYLVGIGFTSSIDPQRWHRKPVNLIAVVDKSGSMSGHPLEMVKLALSEMLKQLGPNDQLSIVLYGDQSHVHLAPAHVTPENRRSIEKSISAIESAGSTAMEEGLVVGYQLAAESGGNFRGITRLMLFTDERPNVGATDAKSFMGMSTEASRRGIGLTTVGVGVQFGAELATKISSVRGGNLYFIRNAEDVKTWYAGQLDYMVSELAHDLRLVIKPHAGYKIAGIYGVPGQMLGWQAQDAVEVKIPTVFLSKHGGAIFASLTPAPEGTFLPRQPMDEQALLTAVEVDYLPLGASTTEKHSIDIAAPSRASSTGMRLGHTLVDEFLALHKAVTAHHVQNDQETAFQLVHALNGRLRASTDSGLDSERTLVQGLDDQLAFLSGHSSESTSKSNFALLWGKWEVTRASGKSGLAARDVIELKPDNTFSVSYSRPRDGQSTNEGEYHSSNDQILLDDWETVFDYRITPSQLVLRRVRSNDKVYLKRVR